MRLLPLTFPTLEENLACDEALLLAAEEGDGGEILRLWEWSQPAVVLGAAGVLDEDVNERACREAGVPIGRRSSGGGTVMLGSGCLVYSFVLAFESADDLTRIGCSYCYILGKMQTALQKAVDDITLAGTSDLAIHGRKFSGNSQQRKRRFLLHHGTILYDFDLAILRDFLNLPQRQPDYREGRDHVTFVRNLALERREIERLVCDEWNIDRETDWWPRDTVRILVDEKYSRDEWLRRR